MIYNPLPVQVMLQGSGEGICRFTLGRKAAEDGVLAVVTYNFRAFS